jgi:peptide/nickel transport system ATP-binding protein
MAVVERVSHRIAVMYLGQIVELGTREQVLRDPRHRYTRRLLDAVLVPDPSLRRGAFSVPEGEIPSSIRPVGSPPERVTMTDVGGGHLVAA